MYPPYSIAVQTALQINKILGFDGGSSVPSTGVHSQFQVPVAGTIVGYTIAAFNSSGVAVSGSAGITISKGALGALASQGSKSLVTASSSSGSLAISLAASNWIDVSLDSVSGSGVIKILVILTVQNTI